MSLRTKPAEKEMEMTPIERNLIATVLVGIGNFRMIATKIHPDNKQLNNKIRANCDIIMESLVGSNIEPRQAIDAWDNIKECIDDLMSKNFSSSNDDLLFLLSGVDEAFYAMVDIFNLFSETSERSI